MSACDNIVDRQNYILAYLRESRGLMGRLFNPRPEAMIHDFLKTYDEDLGDVVFTILGKDENKLNVFYLTLQLLDKIKCVGGDENGTISEDEIKAICSNEIEWIALGLIALDKILKNKTVKSEAILQKSLKRFVIFKVDDRIKCLKGLGQLATRFKLTGRSHKTVALIFQSVFYVASLKVSVRATKSADKHTQVTIDFTEALVLLEKHKLDSDDNIGKLCQCLDEPIIDVVAYKEDGTAVVGTIDKALGLLSTAECLSQQTFDCIIENESCYKTAERVIQLITLNVIDGDMSVATEPAFFSGNSREAIPAAADISPSSQHAR